MAVDHRSDIYSLGAIMYELFCGQPMFRGRSFGEYVRKHLTEIPVPPRQTPNGAAIEPGLEALILRCLLKEPNDRFSHILELRDGLLGMLGGIETHPPGYASLAQSGVRPAQTAPPQAMLPHALPLPPPGMVTTMPTPPQLSGMHPSSVMSYSHYSVPPESVHEPVTPWWVWFIGGAVAVGLGIAGALWVANRPDEQPAVQRPTTAPIDPSPTQLVELRFDSLPSAGVYADGRSAELCRTPCNFNVDLADGGPTDRRAFVVRTEGYRDKPVIVDFASAQRAYSVTLEASEPTVKEPDPVAEADPDPAIEIDEPAGKPTRGTKKIGIKKTTKKNEDKITKKPADDTGLEKPEGKTTDDRSAADKKPEPKKPIDPTDTIDPFRRKK
jgi:serine/threonine-protein kinase